MGSRVRSFREGSLKNFKSRRNLYFVDNDMTVHNSEYLITQWFLHSKGDLCREYLLHFMWSGLV